MKKPSIDVVFKTAAVYDVKSMSVNAGEVFTLIPHDLGSQVDWYANHDNVLQINQAVDSQSAEIEALKEGHSTIILVGQFHIIYFKITVNKAKAATLGLIVEKPVLK